MDKITDEIFISGKTSKARVAYNKIKYCINISGVPVEYKVDEVYPIADDYEGNRPEQFIKILKIIDRQVKANNTPILIMCHGGVSRSPTIAALYLFYNHTFDSFDEALAYVKSQSKTAQFNLSLVDFIKREVVPLLKRRGR